MRCQHVNTEIEMGFVARHTWAARLAAAWIAALSSGPMKAIDVVQTLGGPSAIGRRLNIRSQAVSIWCARNRIPAERVPELVRMARDLGLAIPPETMRPDVDWAALRA